MADEDIVLNVSRLRVLRELAQRGTIAAVAEALWLTPSAVSQQLSALERETRVALVERAGRGVRLTAAGRVLVERSERVFEALDEAKAALQALQSEPTGRLRVASFPSVVRVVFPLMAPATGTVAILAGLIVWNDFFTPLIFLNGSDAQTLPVVMFNYVGALVSQWNLIFAIVLISMVPILTFYIFAQRKFIQGFSGGLKG